VSVPTHNYSSGNAYSWGNCTWGVKAYFGNRVGDYWGNGEDWANSARNAGFTVDGNPVAWNTVAVFSGGLYGSSTQYGHVAIVSDVKGEDVEVYEMNVAGLGAYSYRWLPKAGLQFIHV
jgi:surface antigen